MDFIPAAEKLTPGRLEPRAVALQVTPDDAPWSTENCTPKGERGVDDQLETTEPVEEMVLVLLASSQTNGGILTMPENIFTLRIRALAGVAAPAPVGGLAYTRTLAKLCVEGVNLAVLQKFTLPVIQIVKRLELPPVRSIVMVTDVVLLGEKAGATEFARNGLLLAWLVLYESTKRRPEVI